MSFRQTFLFMSLIFMLPLQASDEALLSEDLQVRKQAMVDLARSKDIERCRNLLKRDEFALRKAAVFALARLNTENETTAQKNAAIASLKEALEDGSFIIRFEAARTLGSWAITSGEPILVEALRHTNPLRRRQSAEALFHIGSSLAIKNLIYNLTDADFTVRRSCIEALRKITGQNFSYVATDPRYLPMEDSEREELLNLRRETLEEISGDEDSEELQARREKAMADISKKFKKKIDDRAVEMQKERRTAINAWKQWWLDHKDGERIDWLISGLTHENPVTRRISALSLGDMGATSALSNIVEKLTDEDTDVAVAACQALTKLRLKESIPELIKVMENTEGAGRAEKGQLIRNYAAYQALLTISQANFSSLSKQWSSWWANSSDYFVIGRDKPHGKYNVRAIERSGNMVTFEVKLFHAAKGEWFTSTFQISAGGTVGEEAVEHKFTIKGRTWTRKFDMRPGLKFDRIKGNFAVLKTTDEGAVSEYSIILP